MCCSQEDQHLFELSVAQLPITIKPRFARVMATFMRLGSVTKPRRPSLLQRTVLNTMTCQFMFFDESHP